MIELSILEINQIEVRAIVPIIQQSEWKVGNQWRVCRGLLSRAWPWAVEAIAVTIAGTTSRDRKDRRRAIRVMAVLQSG